MLHNSMRKIRLILLIAVIVASLSFLAVKPVLAQGSVTYNWPGDPAVVLSGPSEDNGSGGIEHGIMLYTSCAAGEISYEVVIDTTNNALSFNVYGYDTDDYSLWTNAYGSITVDHLLGGHAVDESATPGINTYTGTATISGDAPAIAVQAAFAGSGTVEIHSIEISCTLATDPTPTPYPPPGSPDPALANFTLCPLLGATTANFVSLPGEWSLNGGAGNPEGETSGLLLPQDGTADLVVSGMNNQDKYSITLVSHYDALDEGDSGPLGEIFLALGQSAYIIDMDATSDRQVYTVPAGNFEPESDGRYILSIDRVVSDSPRSVIVDSVCITNTSGIRAGAQFTPTPDQTPGQCQVCVYAPTGDILHDAGLLFQWLWCLISNIWFCTLLPLLTSIWNTILNVLRIIGYMRIWLSTFLMRGIAWIGSTIPSLWNFLGGFLQNIVTTIFNTGLSALNDIHSTIFGIVDDLALVANVLLQTLNIVFSIIDTLFGGMFLRVAQVLGTIPLLIASIVTGFNASAASVPIYAPTCSDPSTFLYYPCIASYVIDNTVLDGPWWYVMPLVLGYLAFTTLLWAAKSVQEAFSK